MTNEQKARQLANEYKNYTHINAIHLHLEGKTKDEVVEQCVYAAAIETAAWKQEQLIQKAVEWLERNFNMPNDFEQHFRKAMEAGQ